MSDSTTKRSHYNPCFWTALWNEDFFQEYVGGRRHRKRARKQPVFALNILADRIISTTFENVHYDNIGLTEMTPDAMLAFCRRYFPGKYPEMSAYIAAHRGRLRAGSAIPKRVRVELWEHMPERPDRRELPRYTVSEVASYLHLPESTVRTWFFGQENFEPLFEPAGESLLSFFNIVEAHSVSWTKDRARGVALAGCGWLA